MRTTSTLTSLDDAPTRVSGETAVCDLNDRPWREMDGSRNGGRFVLGLSEADGRPEIDRKPETLRKVCEACDG